MFTGIIEEVGRVGSVAKLPSGQGLRIAVGAGVLVPPMELGASLAVDGVCLTVIATAQGRVELEVGPETLERSTLGALTVGQPINLERAMKLGERLGGHLVQGHVDGVGRVVEARTRGEAWDLRIAMPAPLTRYVIEKGSIAVDGISLTVNALEPDGLWVSLIPHTQSATTIRDRKAGDRVNLEVDLIAKYVERLLGPRAPKDGDGGLTVDELKENGFG